MLVSLLYFLVRLVLGAGSRQHAARDIELFVLRHQVKVLQRQVERPRLNRLDRVLLAAASTWLQRGGWSSFIGAAGRRSSGRLVVVHRGGWSSFIVCPETLLRWHRELVRTRSTASSAS